LARCIGEDKRLPRIDRKQADILRVLQVASCPKLNELFAT